MEANGIKTKNRLLIKGMFPTFLLCSIGGGIIYLLPYLSNQYSLAMQEALKATPTQVGTMVTMFGIINWILYLPSGLLADKFSSKKLMVFSLIATGLLGGIYAMFPPVWLMYILHILLGITSTFTFWSVCIAVVRAIGTENAQGTVYSIWYILKGTFVGLASLIGVVIFGAFAAKGNGIEGLRAIILFYSGLTLLTGVLGIFLFKDVRLSETSDFKMKDVKEFKKYPALWVAGIAAMAVWVVYICCFQMPQYLTQIFGMSQEKASLWKTLTSLAFPFPAALLAGFLSDKLFKSKMQFISVMMVLMTLTAALFLIVPTGAGVAVQIVLFVLLNEFMVGAIALIFSIISELGVPPALSGTAAGILSFMYYLPETFGYLVTNKFVEDAKGHEIDGYRNVFIFMLAFCVLGTVAIYLTRLIVTRTKKHISASAGEDLVLAMPEGIKTDVKVKNIETEDKLQERAIVCDHDDVSESIEEGYKAVSDNE